MPLNEPQPDPAIPTRPGWLLPEAKREWNRIVPQLSALGLLTALDRGAIAGGCQWWGMFVDAVKDIEKNGTTFETDTGYQGPRPSVALAIKSWQQYLAFAARFGLTPSDRSRLSIPEKAPADPFSAFLSGKSSLDEMDRVRSFNEPQEDVER
jgi:P27 family predicted phage terminase small subunit